MKLQYEAVGIIDERTERAYIGITGPTNGGGRRMVIMDTDVADDPKRARTALMADGIKLVGSKAAQGRRVAQIVASVPKKPLVLAMKPGFRGRGFILGPRMLGDAKQAYCWRASTIAKGVGETSGNLKGWHRDVGACLQSSSFAMTGIFAGLAAALPSYVNLHIGDTVGLRPLLSETYLLNYSGLSGTGKSSIGRAVAGLFGAPLIDKWDFTRRGLEEGAESHHDLPYVLDDTETHLDQGMSLKTAIRAVNQIIASGQSRRMSKSAQSNDLHHLTWSTIGISSSPIPIDKLAENNGYTRTKGEQVRMINIPLPTPARAGLFDRHPANVASRVKRGKRLIKKLEAGTNKHYGLIYPAWIEFLLSDNHSLRVQELTDKFVKRVASEGNGWDERLAIKFGVLYAAGKLAVESGVLPWDKNLPWKAVKRCYDRAVAGLADTESLAKARLAKLRLLCKGKLAFPKAKRGPNVISFKAQTIGVRTTTNGKEVLAIRKEDFERFAQSKPVAKQMLAMLRDSGALRSGQGHAATTQLPIAISTNGVVTKKPRFYVIDAKALKRTATAKS